MEFHTHITIIIFNFFKIAQDFIQLLSEALLESTHLSLKIARTPAAHPKFGGPRVSEGGK